MAFQTSPFYLETDPKSACRRADAFDQAAPFVTAPFRLCRFGTVRLLCPVEVLSERSREMASGWRGTIYGTIEKNIWNEKAPLAKLHEACLT